MGVPDPAKRYTSEEYYRLERAAAWKSDYYNGEIFAMAGGTTRQSLIVMNIGGELRQRLKGNPCAPYDSNQRLKINDAGLRVYPDVSLYCGPLEYDEEDANAETATNPVVLFEVRSDHRRDGDIKPETKPRRHSVPALRGRNPSPCSGTEGQLLSSSNPDPLDFPAFECPAVRSATSMRPPFVR
jgi:Uma2 family endonuclease